MQPVRTHRFAGTKCMLLFLLVISIWLSGHRVVVAASFTVLHTNDEHGALIPRGPAVDRDLDDWDPTTGGFARLAGALADQRNQRSEPVVTVSAGDFVSGSPFSWLKLRGLAPELSLLVDMGYDVVALGNHEYDYGPDWLATYLAAAGFPGAAGTTALLASNAEIPADHSLRQRGIQKVHLLPLEDQGLTLGFFSVLGDHAQMVTAMADPVTFADPMLAARAAVDELLAQGADILIAVNHAGLTEDRALALAIPEIHLIISGHCHTPLSEPERVGKTLIAQSGSRLEYVGVLELDFDRETDRLELRNSETGHPFLLPLDDTIQEDLVIAGHVERYQREVNALLSEMSSGVYEDLLAVIARSSGPILRDTAPATESALGNLFTDAMRWAVWQAEGRMPDGAFQANGQIRGDIIPGSTDSRRGLISVYDVLEQVGMGMGPDELPGYPLVSMYLTGDEVRNALEISLLLSHIMGNDAFLQVSGLSMTYDAGRSILFWVPVRNIPIPTYRGVLDAQVTTNGGDAQPLESGDERLYHIVGDLYVASFIPMVGNILPRLTIEPKDRDGRVVDDLEELIVFDEGRELKSWQAVLAYVQSLERVDGLPTIEAQYLVPEGRLMAVSTFPLWAVYGLILTLAFSTAVVLGLRWISARRNRVKT